MNKSFKMPTTQQVVVWLEAAEYGQVLSHCEPFLKSKIRTYLRNFPAYYAYQDDFFQEIYIHLLVKTFPSRGFRQACEDEQKFRHYFIRVIFNQLNTLLQRERNQQRGTVAWGEAIASNNTEDEGKDKDKATWLEDKAHSNTQESQQLLACLQSRFEQFLSQFSLLFPKIATKLAFLLKITARARITAEDIKVCFTAIPASEIQEVLYLLSIKSNYQEADDLTVFEIFKPLFETYRGETATAHSIQRWVNLQISGDRGKKGVLAYMTIQDGEKLWEIQDKRVFSDFLHYHYQQEEKQVAATQTTYAYTAKKSYWEKVFVPAQQGAFLGKMS